MTYKRQKCALTCKQNYHLSTTPCGNILHMPDPWWKELRASNHALTQEVGFKKHGPKSMILLAAVSHSSGLGLKLRRRTASVTRMILESIKTQKMRLRGHDSVKIKPAFTDINKNRNSAMFAAEKRLRQTSKPKAKM